MNSSERDILIIKSSERYFSLGAELIDKILEEKPVTPLPFLEFYVDGLVNVNGQVAVQIDFEKFIGNFNEIDIERKVQPVKKELLMITNDSGVYVLKIDEVCEKITLAESELRAFQLDQPDQDSSVVQAEFEWRGSTVLHIANDPLQKVLNVINVPKNKRAILGQSKTLTTERNQTLEPYIILNASNELFSFRLTDVIEIFEAEDVTPVPKSDRCVLGISVIREQAVLVLSASELLHLDEKRSSDESEAPGDQQKSFLLVLFKFNGSVLALAFDGVVGIQSIDEQKIKHQGSFKETGVLLSETDELITLLSLNLLISKELYNELLSYMPKNSDKNEKLLVETEKFLQVSYMKEKLIFPCECVSRILEYKAPNLIDTELQMREQSFMGLTELDGKVLPVLDISTQKTKNIGEEAGLFGVYIVLKGNKNEFVVPASDAEKIVEIPKPDINYYTDEDAGLVSAVAKHDGRLLSLIDVAHIEATYFGASNS